MRPHHRTTAIVLALVAVVFGVFFRTLESGFLRWDDDINVFENPHVQGLTAENLRWMFTDFEQAIRYKPLSWLAWAVVHEVFGLNPFGYHLANVLLHCANTVLVFLLIRRVLALSSSLAPTGGEGWGEGEARLHRDLYASRLAAELRGDGRGAGRERTHLTVRADGGDGGVVRRELRWQIGRAHV